MGRGTGEGRLNLEQIRDGLVNGTINIDFAGHRGNGKVYELKQLIEGLTDAVEICYELEAEGNQKMFDFDMRPRKAGESLGIMSPEMYCFECGRNLRYILKDSNTLAFDLTYNQKENNETDNTCPMKDTGKSFSFEIKVESGKLVIANYFDDRKDDGQGNKIEIFEPENKYSRGFDLNCALGRMNITKHYAEKHNIAYAQMGNMGIGVFINKTHDGIIIGDQARKRIKGHSHVGKISLSVWRWMAADLAVLEKNNIVLDADSIILDVANGVYKVTNYYEFSNNMDPIYSTLARKE